jgi:microcystin-dependent protein
VSISSNTALFTPLGGSTYGGNGTTAFALPDLRGAEPKGQGLLGVHYYIRTQGVYP